MEQTLFKYNFDTNENINTFSVEWDDGQGISYIFSDFRELKEQLTHTVLDSTNPGIMGLAWCAAQSTNQQDFENLLDTKMLSRVTRFDLSQQEVNVFGFRNV